MERHAESMTYELLQVVEGLTSKAYAFEVALSRKNTGMVCGTTPPARKVTFFGNNEERIPCGHDVFFRPAAEGALSPLSYSFIPEDQSNNNSPFAPQGGASPCAPQGGASRGTMSRGTMRMLRVAISSSRTSTSLRWNVMLKA